MPLAAKAANVVGAESSVTRTVVPVDSNAQRSPRGMRKCDVDIRRDLGAKDVLPGIGLVLQRFSDSDGERSVGVGALWSGRAFARA